MDECVRGQAFCCPSVQDLEYLCEGLEGRSSNPVAVLFDSLLLPDSDFGLDRVSPLEWRYEPEHAIPHLVLGKGPPGGAWHVRGQRRYCGVFIRSFSRVISCHLTSCCRQWRAPC